MKIEDGIALLQIDGEDVPLGNVTQVLGRPPEPEITGDTSSGDDASDDGNV